VKARINSKIPFLDLRHGYDHPLRYTKTTQVLKASKPMSFRRCFGPEYLSGLLKAWAEARSIHIQYIQPGKPQQNAYIDRYNRTVCHEWLDQNIFEIIQEA